MAPFAGNLGFLLLECTEEPTDRVAAFLQEEMIQIPGCNNKVCDWNQFKNAYQVRIKSSD